MRWPVLVFFLTSRRPPRSPLFPYTTLFRSLPANAVLVPLALAMYVPSSILVVMGQEYLPSRVGRYSWPIDRKSTRLNSSHLGLSYAVFCLEKKTFTASA